MNTSSSCICLYTPSTISLMRKSSNPRTVLGFNNTTSIFRRKLLINEKYSTTCRSVASSSSSVTEFDLYDLLGIDSSSDQLQIKLAYRGLQKRCHPDIAGPAGHDMAIILNEAYSVLSDPNSRLAYDKEQEKIAELRGYTGKPIYSVWLGSEKEERAVFVDEVKCVGCLKCALFAKNTFAIESVYGRARVVAQWADPEHKIVEAIETCPVDCISIVGRSDLAALEFLMSKQPRGNVRVGMGNAAGARVSNVFVDVKKFQTRFKDAMDKASSQNDKEADLQREARMSAIQVIRSISNLLYWQTPRAGIFTKANLTHIPRKCRQPNIGKLRDAAAARKRIKANIAGSKSPTASNYIYNDEYWIPLPLALPASTPNKTTPEEILKNPPSTNLRRAKERVSKANENRSNPISSGVPMAMAAIASAIVRLQGEGSRFGGLKEHIGGSLALEMVNSSWSQIMLAGITWYIIGIVFIEIADAIIGRKGRL